MITCQAFMMKAKLKKGVFTPCTENDHEYCAMCAAKFSKGPGDLQEGYVALDGQHWVCPECIKDYAEQYLWSLKDNKLTLILAV